MKHHRALGALAFAGVAALVLSGCSTAGTGGEEQIVQTNQDINTADYNPQPRENLKQGGTVNFQIDEIPDQLNRFHGDGTANTGKLSYWYNPQIILLDPDGTPKKNDDYLDKWEIATVDGKTQITFTFTDEAVWNDGTPMDWTAIDATWKANRSHDGFNPNSMDGYKEIESVVQGDTAKTAVVTFAMEYAWPQKPFLLGIVHPKMATPDTFNNARIGDPRADLGAGPYTVDEFDAGKDFISFKPNPKWWGDKPLLDKVTFTGMDAQASINAFKNGQIDFVAAGTKDRLAQIADMQDVTVYRGQQTSNTLLEVDAEKPQFQEVEVRQAFFMAVDVELQKKIAWNGLGYQEGPAGSLTLFSFQDGYSDSLQKAGMKHDPEGANKLLDDAGWVKGDDGIREKDGVRLEIVYPVFSNDPTDAAVAQSLQKMEEEIGFDVKVDVRPASKYSEDYKSKNWDAVSLKFSSAMPFGPSSFFQLYGTGQGLNLSGVQTEEMDKRIHEEVEAVPGQKEQTQAALALEVEILQSWGVMPLWNGPSIFAAKNGLANLTPEPYAGLDLFGMRRVEDLGWEK